MLFVCIFYFTAFTYCQGTGFNALYYGFKELNVRRKKLSSKKYCKVEEKFSRKVVFLKEGCWLLGARGHCLKKTILEKVL